MVEFMLVDQENGIAPWGGVGENKLHDVTNEHVVKVGLDVEW